MEELEPNLEKRKFSHNDSDDTPAAIKKKPTSCAPTSGLRITVSIEGSESELDRLLGLEEDVAELLGCMISSDHRASQGELTRKVLLTGGPDELARSLLLISELVKLPERKDKLTIIEASHRIENEPELTASSDNNILMCPYGKVGAVIGHRGATVTEIFKRTGCRVHIDQDSASEGEDRIVKFFGNPYQIEEAKVLVESIIVRGLSALSSNQSNETVAVLYKDEFEIHPSKTGAIIGAKGGVITEVMLRSGCKIQIDQSNISAPKVCIQGESQELVDGARMLIEDIIRNGNAHFVKESSQIRVSQDLSILDYQFRRLLVPGEGGIDLLNELQQHHAVKIKVDMNVDQSPCGLVVHKLELVGDLRKVQTCVRAVFDLLGQTVEQHRPRDGASRSAQSKPVCSAHAQQIISPNPTAYLLANDLDQLSSLNLLEASDTHAQLARPASRSSTTPISPSSPHAVRSGDTPAFGLGLDGTLGVVHPAVVLSDGMHYVVAEVRNEQMGKIIGKAGANLSLIRNKSGASLQVMKQVMTSGYTQIVVVGLPSCVAIVGQIFQEVRLVSHA